MAYKKYEYFKLNMDFESGKKFIEKSSGYKFQYEGITFFIEKYGENGIFDAFTNYLDLPPQATGKNIHTYIDYEIQGEITDYKGSTAHYNERTGVHLEPTGYTLSLSVMYINYLRGIKFKD